MGAMGISTTPLFTKSCIAPGRHPVEDLYGAMVSLICSGASLQWFKNEFLSEDFERINEEASKRRNKINGKCSQNQCIDALFSPSSSFPYPSPPSTKNT